MNYQEITLLEGAKLTVDFDAKKARCKKCGKPIRFGISPVGSHIPIIEHESGEWMSHFNDCRVPVQEELFIERNVASLDRNQNLLSSL